MRDEAHLFSTVAGQSVAASISIWDARRYGVALSVMWVRSLSILPSSLPVDLDCAFSAQCPPAAYVVRQHEQDRNGPNLLQSAHRELL